MEGTGKLVRDRIPELIRAEGGEPQTRTAHGEEYPALLRLKLLEEVQEFLDSDEPAELVDVIEVVHALAGLKGMAPDRLEELRAAKQAERGGFSAQTVLISQPDEAPTVENPVPPTPNGNPKPRPQPQPAR
ncbi:MAG: nucleoside triphosphate pyrophosphohydrolase [Micromonosporaceae bacterium]